MTDVTEWRLMYNQEISVYTRTHSLYAHSSPASRYPDPASFIQFPAGSSDRIRMVGAWLHVSMSLSSRQNSGAQNCEGGGPGSGLTLDHWECLFIEV